MCDDDEPEVFYGDARDTLLSSAADKRRKALKHFNFFLRDYCVQIKVKVTEADEIPYHGLLLSNQTDSKSVFKFWDDMMGAFITYIGKHATAACNPKRPRIGQSTADGFSSSVKVYFTDRFRIETPIPVFQKDQWKKLKDKLRGFYRESNRSEGKQTQDVSSTRQDREAMATACIWMGKPEFAEFWHLCTTSYHCSGRASEVSLIKADDVSTTEINELVYRYNVLSVAVQRQKDGPWDNLPIYPHRDSIFEDFYFSLIHLLVVKGCGHGYVLPLFSSEALKTKRSGESDSRVSQRWANFFAKIRDTFEILADEINEELGSHSNRRGANQAMVENPSLNGYAPIFRSGFRSKSIHTIFDYVFGSAELLRQAGKSLAMWNTKIGETTMGGQPPTFDDIDTDIEGLKKFTDVLFEDDTVGRWSPKVRELLVMTLLLRYDQFVDVLQAHPYTRLVETHPDPVCGDDPYTFSAVRDNLFISRVEQAWQRVTGVNPDELHGMFFDNPFPDWCREARKAFLSRNAPALPITTHSYYGGNSKDILLDTRNLIDHFNALASIAQANHMELQHHRHILNDIRSAINVESKITSSFIVNKIFSIEKTLRRLEENLIPLAPRPTTPPPKGLIRFSIAVQALSKSASLTETTIAFFADDYIAGYKLDTSHPSWEEKDPQEKRSLRNKFSLLKRVVRVMLLHSDCFPVKPENPARYKEIIRDIATKAEERIREAIGFDDRTIITIYKLEKQLKLVKLETVRQLPDNTPDDIRKFFNSATN